MRSAAERRSGPPRHAAPRRRTRARNRESLRAKVERPSSPSARASCAFMKSFASRICRLNRLDALMRPAADAQHGRIELGEPADLQQLLAARVEEEGRDAERQRLGGEDHAQPGDHMAMGDGRDRQQLQRQNLRLPEGRRRRASRPARGPAMKTRSRVSSSFTPKALASRRSHTSHGPTASSRLRNSTARPNQEGAREALLHRFHWRSSPIGRGGATAARRRVSPRWAFVAQMSRAAVSTRRGLLLAYCF